MKIKSVSSASFIVALVVFIVCFTEGIFTIGNSYLIVVSEAIVIALITYLVSNFVITRYVVFRIKPLYQIILERNIKSRELIEKSHHENIVESISNELTEWADRKSEEITRLKQLETYRKEFLGNVSHELKTPLFTMQSYLLTLLDDDLEDKETAIKFLKNSEKSLERLIHIVGDLEEISHLEMNVSHLNRAKFDIAQLTGEIMERMSYEAKERNIKLICDISKEIFVYADIERIEQVMINLIANAVKYGKSGGYVNVNFIDGFNKVVVEVTDNGIGIAKDDIPRIFERFYRVDKSRSRETGGTGLGLAIVKHIVEAHGEKITVRSAMNEFTTFSFALNKYLA